RRPARRSDAKDARRAALPGRIGAGTLHRPRRASRALSRRRGARAPHPRRRTRRPCRRGRACPRSGTGRARSSRRSIPVTALIAVAFALAVMVFLRLRWWDAGDARDEVVRRGQEVLLERRRNTVRVDRGDRLLLQTPRGRERAAAVP